jgi:hypothetical protein
MRKTTDNMEIQDGRDNPIFIHSELDDYGLTLVEFRVYARLARRCGKAAAYESVPNMARAFGVKDRTVQRALKLLISARLIVAKPRPGFSTIYTLLPFSAWLPADSLDALRAQIAKPPKPEKADPVVTQGPGVTGDTGAGGVVTQGPGVVVTSGPEEGSPSEGSPPKVLSHTHARARARLRAIGAPAVVVGEDSKFSLEECRMYADYLHAKGEGVTNPGGFATARHRDGAADAQIADFLVEREQVLEGKRPVEQQLTPFHVAAQFVNSVAQVPRYDVAGYIAQMPNLTDETRERLRSTFLGAPANGVEARSA